MVHFAITRYVDCARHLACGYAACGSMLNVGGSGGTWAHYSGNFWWARCDYVRRLEPLRVERLDMTTHTPKGDPPKGRYLAEWWLGSIAGQNHTRGAAPVRFKNCWAQPSQFAKKGRLNNIRVKLGEPKRCRGEVPDPQAACA